MRENGKVVNKIEDRGFCFIRPDVPIPALPPGKNLFLHFRNLEAEWENLQEGDRVSFLISKGQKGFEATAAKIENQ